MVKLMAKYWTGMRTFSIGNLLIDIADFLETRIEQDTLVAYFPQADFANVRFSILTVTENNGKEVAQAGKNFVKKRAAALGAKLYHEKNLVWYCVSKPASEGSPGSLMYFWYVGMNGQVVIVSCFIDAAYKDTADAKRILDAVRLSVKSIRGK